MRDYTRGNYGGKLGIDSRLRVLYNRHMQTMTRTDNPMAQVFAVMAEQGRTQAWLARKLGVTRGMVNHYKMGRYRPNDEQIRRAHELLGLPMPADNERRTS